MNKNELFKNFNEIQAEINAKTIPMHKYTSYITGIDGLEKGNKNNLKNSNIQYLNEQPDEANSRRLLYMLGLDTILHSYNNSKDLIAELLRKRLYFFNSEIDKLEADLRNIRFSLMNLKLISRDNLTISEYQFQNLNLDINSINIQKKD